MKTIWDYYKHCQVPHIRSFPVHTLPTMYEDVFYIASLVNSLVPNIRFLPISLGEKWYIIYTYLSVFFNLSPINVQYY